jgi:hypothetical protein
VLPPSRSVQTGLLPVSKTPDQLDTAPQTLAHRSDPGDPCRLPWHLRIEPPWDCWGFHTWETRMESRRNTTSAAGGIRWRKSCGGADGEDSAR